MTSLAPGPGRKSHLQGQDQLPDFQFHLMPQPPCPCSSSLFPKWSHWSQMVEWALYFNSKRAWKFGDKIAIRRNKWGRGEEKIMREKQAGRGHQRNIAGQQETWAPPESSHFILSCLRILQHTPVHTHVNPSMLCSPTPRLPELSPKENYSMVLTWSASACTAPPLWQAGSPLGWARDLPWRYGLQISLPVTPTHPDSAAHLSPCLSPNCSFSVHNPNHREMNKIRKIF